MFVATEHLLNRLVMFRELTTCSGKSYLLNVEVKAQFPSFQLRSRLYQMESHFWDSFIQKGASGRREHQVEMLHRTHILMRIAEHEGEISGTPEVVMQMSWDDMHARSVRCVNSHIRAQKGLYWRGLVCNLWSVLVCESLNLLKFSTGFLTLYNKLFFYFNSCVSCCSWTRSLVIDVNSKVIIFTRFRIQESQVQWVVSSSRHTLKW